MYTPSFLYIHKPRSMHDNYYVFDTIMGAKYPFWYMVILFIFQMGALVKDNWVLTVAFLPMFIIFALYEGVEVNIAKMQFRDYTHLFQWWWGRFKPIEDPDYLLLSRTSDTRNGGIRYDVHLITKGSRDLLLFRTKNLEDHENVVKVLAQRTGWKAYRNTIDGLEGFE